MFLYHLFSHDGIGNFSLLREFKAQNDDAAQRSVDQSQQGPLELWQASRRVKRWA
jgi:hypothetical protein